MLEKLQNKIINTMFYKPTLSCLGLAVSVMKGTLQIFIAKSLNKVTSFAKPGERRYDHEHSFVFSLNSNECYILDKIFDELIAGTRPSYEFLHQTRKLVVKHAVGNKSGLETLIIAIADTERKETAPYIFTVENGELEIFRGFLKRMYDTFPFVCATITGMIKASKSRDRQELPYYNNNNNSNTTAIDDIFDETSIMVTNNDLEDLSNL